MFSRLRLPHACALLVLALVGVGAAGANAAPTTVRGSAGSTTTTPFTSAARAAAKQRPPAVPGGGSSVRPRLRLGKHAPAPALAVPAPAVPVAHAASDPGVGILDFRFAPPTTTVHVGDTVTWTNNGRAPHSATANDGSFNTGILRPGASASHTFARAGTFTYFCSVHPFMHGTIVVVGSSASAPSTPAAPSAPASSGTSGTGSTPSAGTTSTATGTAPGASGSSTRPTLPLTGSDAGGVLAAGLALLCLGGLGRRALRRAFTLR